MLRGAEKLDSLYQSMDESVPVSIKAIRKKEMIEKIVNALDTLSLRATTSKPSLRFRQSLPNNAYFMNFIRYQSQQDLFSREWKQEFNGDLKRYIAYLSNKYPFL
jgi:hypothetical protein